MENSSLKPQEVADILKIAKNTVYELIKRGELEAYRIGRKVRVDMKAVEEYKARSKGQKNSSFKVTESPRMHTVQPRQWSLEEIPQNRGFVLCGQEALLDVLSRYLEYHPNGIQTYRSYIGCYNGLFALYQGKVEIATAHLWDGDTNTYNTEYVRRLLPGVPAIVVHLACRMQGFYVKKGNPKSINTWEDLKRPDITIINREKGSGTRVLLDEHLRLMGVYGSSIQGYDRECASHLAVASNIVRGGADVGLGNEKTALQVEGIDFIPLHKERYELVFKKEDANKPHFRALIDILSSEEFKEELLGIGGYDISETGKIVAEI